MSGFQRDEASGPSSPTPQRKLGLVEAGRLEEVGDLHLEAASYSSAIDYFRSALELLPSGNGSAVQIRLRRKLAVAFLDQGHIDRAEEQISAALALLSDASPSTHAVLRLRQAEISYRRGRFQEAEKKARSAFSVLATTDLHREVGNAQVILGNCSLRRGRGEKSEEFYRDALATFRRIGDAVGQVHVLANLATLAKNACQWSSALKYLERATTLARDHGATHEMCSLYLNQAILFRKMGRTSEAVALVDKGSRLAQHLGNQDLLINYRLLQGQIHVDASSFPRAEETLLEARVLAEGNGSLRQTALADEFLGDLMAAQGRTTQAEVNYELAAERARAISPANDILAEVLRRQAQLALAGGDADRTLDLVDRGVAVVSACGENFELGFLLRARGQALRKLGEVDEGIRAVEGAVQRFRSYRLPGEVAVTLELLADFFLEIGSREGRLRARACLREAVEIVSASNTPNSPCALHLALARVEMELGNHDGALLALYEVERLSCGTESTVVRQLEVLRREIDSAMSQQAHEARSSYQLLADLPDLLSDAGDPLKRNLHSVVRALAQRLSADRGAIMVKGSTGARVLCTLGDDAVPQEILNLAMERLRVENSRGSRVWSHPQGDPSWRDALPHELLRDVRAAAALPIWMGDDLRGLLYFDRSGTSEEHLGFGGDALAMASSYVSILKEAVLDTVRENESASASLLEEEAFQNILTQSDAMVEVLGLCAKVAASPYTVLFTGETGTGKGLLAYALHRLSPWRDRSFVSINCAALPESLLESELFGHVKGAFTGAVGDKAGLIAAAEGGTLLLDEIGKMSLPMQAKLLHFLDTKVVRPVGGEVSREIDVRILCATKHDLKQMVDRDEFLEDLYYRLLDFPIRVPPLRERPGDVLLLARHYVQKTAAELGHPCPSMTRGFSSRLEAYPWPGNVRELEKTMKRTVVLASGEDSLRAEHLPREARQAKERGGIRYADTLPLKEQVAALEREALQSTLDRVGWNRAEAARRLRISYPTLLQKIKTYDLRPA